MTESTYLQGAENSMLRSWARRKAILLASLFLMTYFFAIMIPEAHSELDISVSPRTRTVSQGSTATFTVTVPYIPCIPPDCPTIMLFVTSQIIQPLTLTLSRSQHTFTAKRSDFISTMSVHVGSSCPPGRYDIQLTAHSDMSIGGVREKTTIVTVEVTGAVAEHLQVHVETDRASYGQGDLVRVTGWVAVGAPPPAGGQAGATVTVSISGPVSPPGLAATTGAGGYFSFSFTITTAWVSGTYTLTAVARKTGFLEGRDTTTFQVTGAGVGFDFSMKISPSVVTVVQGENAHYRIDLTYSDPSYAGTTINLQLTGLGSGMDSHVTQTGDMTITTEPTTPTGEYTIIAIGSAMGVTHQASATLIVTATQPPAAEFDFGMSISPIERAVSPGGSATFTVTVDLVAGSAQDVTLSLSGPADLMAEGGFNPSSGRPDPTFSSTLTIWTGPSASSGRFSLTVTGSGGGRVHTTIVDLVVLSVATTVTAPPPPQTSTTVLPPPPQTVTTTTTTAPPLVPGFPDLTWIIIGILAVLIVIFAAFALRRRGPAYPPAPPPSVQPAPPTPTEKPKPSMLHCVHCGTENPPTNEYCGKCGEKLLRPS